MSNIVSIRGSRDGHDRALKVGDMAPGMTRYVAETAIVGNLLRESRTVSRVPYDKFSVRIECIAPHRYAIAYEGNQEGVIEPSAWEYVIDPESELQPVVRKIRGFFEADPDDQS